MHFKKNYIYIYIFQFKPLHHTASRGWHVGNLISQRLTEGAVSHGPNELDALSKTDLGYDDLFGMLLHVPVSMLICILILVLM